MENEKDGIEDRAGVFCTTTTRCFGEGGQPLSAERMMANFARTETATLTDVNNRLRDALLSIQHITDGHGCGRYQILCSACEAKRIATEALTIKP